MNGITILSTIPPTEISMAQYVGVAFLMAGLVIFLVGCVYSLLDVWSEIGATLCVVGFLIIGISGFSLANTHKIVDYETYQIAIDSTVTAQEFNGKYEILEYEEETYLVKERKN